MQTSKDNVHIDTQYIFVKYLTVQIRPMKFEWTMHGIAVYKIVVL